MATVAPPLVVSAHLGIAEAARGLALERVAGRRRDPDLQALAGEMENALTTAALGVDSMVDQVGDLCFAPDLEMVDRA